MNIKERRARLDQSDQAALGRLVTDDASELAYVDICEANAARKKAARDGALAKLATFYGAS